jgi:hypothetical protein
MNTDSLNLTTIEFRIYTFLRNSTGITRWLNFNYANVSVHFTCIDEKLNNYFSLISEDVYPA